MAVAYDSVSAPQSFAGVTSLSWSHTNVGTSNLYLRVCLPWTSVFICPVSAISYDGVSMLSNRVGNIHVATFQSSLGGDASIYELPNPSTGTKTVSVTFSGGTVYGGGAGSIMYTGVNQTTPSGTAVTNSGTGTSSSTTVNSTTAGNTVGDCVAAEDVGGGAPPTAGSTGRLSGESTAGHACGGAQDAAAGGNITLSWTHNVLRQWVSVAAEILAAPSGVSADIAANESTDVAAVVAANWNTSQVAAGESTDVATVAASVTTGAAVAAAESPDASALTAANWTTAAVAAAVESPDSAAIAADNLTTAQVGAAESPDIAAVAVDNWTTALIAAAEASDNAAVVASATTGADVEATESPDSAAIIGEGNAAITSTAIAAAESPDLATIVGIATTGAALAAQESPDSAAIATSIVAAAVIGATESPDTTAIVADTGTEPEPVPTPSFGVRTFGRPIYRKKLAQRITRAGIGCTESPDTCAIYAVNDRTAPFESIDDLVAAQAEYNALQRRLEIERDDMELLLEL